MNYLESFRKIKTFIFDVDGVLTDNGVIILENGRLLRKMSVRDGYAIKHAIAQKYRVCIITGGNSSGVVQRLRNLGVTDIYSGVEDKLEVYEELKETYNLQHEKVLYMGDDIPDYEVMRKVGLAACPKNATPEIKSVSQYISPYNGGEGCARDVIEKVLKLHRKWTKHPDLKPPA